MHKRQRQNRGHLSAPCNINSLPDAPGVYIFKDRRGEALYIGKAKSLKKRAQSYFTRYLSSKTQTLVSKIADIEYILSPSESQAQLLEAALIKARQPQYNVSLKDDKSFPLIRITDEDFPVVCICRRKKSGIKVRDLYYGPYTNAQLLRQALKMIRRIFGFRSCKKMPKRDCLYYRLKLCPAPCIGKINSDEYKEVIKNIQMFLDSRYEELLNRLSYKMKEAAGEQRFEDALKIKEQINALSVIGQTKNHFTSPRHTGAEFDALDELKDLKNLLRLDKLPERIEAFDISNISGRQATGSMVSFYRGRPDKKNYRRFRIKLKAVIDDYKMLREVIHRRYSRLINEDMPLPNLILIDGGRSHLLVAENEIKKLGIDVPLVSIAKSRKMAATPILWGKDKENIYIQNKINPALSYLDHKLHRRKGGINPIRLNLDTPALNLIRRVRNEAHRFALAYHHLLRRKKIIGK